MAAKAGMLLRPSVVDIEPLVIRWNRFVPCPGLATLDQLKRLLSINIRDVHLCYRMAARQLTEQGEEAELLVSSLTSYMAR